MLSKRSLLRRAIAVAGGGLIASGTAGAAPIGGSSSTAQRHRQNGYDASAVVDAETTVTASVERPVLNVVGLPGPVGNALTDIRQQYSSVSLEDIQRVSASAAIDGETITGGCAIATGSFDSQAIGAQAREHGLTDVESTDDEHRMEAGPHQQRATGTGSSRSITPTTREPETVDRFAAADSPYAIGVDDSTLYVGYDHGETDARTHVDTALEMNADRQSRPTQSGTVAGANYGSLPSLLSGHAVAYASLGSDTRRSLCSRLTDAPDAFKSAIRAASAAGVALQAGSDRSRLRYGIVADPNRVSAETVRNIVTEATTGSQSLESDGIYRSGNTIVFDATVETDALWASHGQFLGIEDTDNRQESTHVL
ncbi:hypothetical protein [Halostagnicola sp. A-GB9-2]|uniref:hypothetical protein n=1 Tax=Halostagnicola sp. A-GB9-2 TaxID=3048066 RepID=UPI0024BF8228|nr:hypothetical protein [Halostagnicola sp. A-GB9-2]MDJ1432860.1 hypothetical protein [Halostagnicola sp. A-GB9-2]